MKSKIIVSLICVCFGIGVIGISSVVQAQSETGPSETEQEIARVRTQMIQYMRELIAALEGRLEEYQRQQSGDGQDDTSDTVTDNDTTEDDPASDEATSTPPAPRLKAEFLGSDVRHEIYYDTHNSRWGIRTWPSNRYRYLRVIHSVDLSVSAKNGDVDVRPSEMSGTIRYNHTPYSSVFFVEENGRHYNGNDTIHISEGEQKQITLKAIADPYRFDAKSEQSIFSLPDAWYVYVVDERGAIEIERTDVRVRDVEKSVIGEVELDVTVHGPNKILRIDELEGELTYDGGQVTTYTGFERSGDMTNIDIDTSEKVSRPILTNNATEQFIIRAVTPHWEEGTYNGSMNLYDIEYPLEAFDFEKDAVDRRLERYR